MALGGPSEAGCLPRLGLRRKRSRGFNFSSTRTVRMYLYNTPPTASYFPLLSGLSSPRILAEHIKVELNALECTLIRLPRQPSTFPYCVVCHRRDSWRSISIIKFFCILYIIRDTRRTTTTAFSVPMAKQSVKEKGRAPPVTWG